MDFSFFFFNDTATTEIYTLSLHDALPIFASVIPGIVFTSRTNGSPASDKSTRSEEHTSELQSQSNLVCRLLLEKKKKRVVGENTKGRLEHMDWRWKPTRGVHAEIQSARRA